MATRKGAKKSSRSGKRTTKAEESQVPPTRATGAGSATGEQIRAEAGQDVPQGEDRGSTVPILGGEPQPDALEGAAPKELQAEPARFVSNGSLEPGMVGSPSGPVPVGTVAASPEEAEKILDEHNKAHDAFVTRRNKKLSKDTVNRLGRAELAAIGQARGYDLAEAGTRRTREAFLAAQDEDTTREEAEA